MNIKNSILAMATMALVLPLSSASCGDDDDDGTAKEPSVTVSLRSQSISEGAEVDAQSTTLLTLTYNVSVKLAASPGITLNGAAVSATRNPQDVTGILIALSLEEGTSYTLIVPEGAVVAGSDAKASAPALTLNFKTKEKVQTPTTDVSSTPLTTNAAARKLYDYLYGQYGKKVISSVMANVNWNNECAEKVYKLTGKYPAMNCYDFIHICYSGSGSWINYDDIKPVQQWVNAGGLVQLMWHVNVPKSEGATDYSFYSDGNSFKASNALVSGTWENKWLYEQMDKVVSVLLKLQQAGIAATWRPFHEAAGNATARQQASWTNAWFWWGTEGAAVYRQLWHAMFDYFKQKGVENLIWVWTTQNYNGNSNTFYQDTDWYPGDEYVDMVARDLYGSDVSANVQEFTEIQAAYPTKMVALGECGYSTGGGARTEQGNIGDCFRQGAQWSHFMAWCQGGQGSTDTMCSDAWWLDAMSSDIVITRDQLPDMR